MKEKLGKDVYFAAIPRDNPTLLASAMVEKITAWRTWATSQGLVDLWNKKLMNYYGASWGGNSSQAVTQGGAQGELSLIKVNDLHNLLQNQLVIVTGQRPAGITRAENSDPDCLKAAKIGTAVSEYYMTVNNYETRFKTAAEIALLCDEGFPELFWDKNLGEENAVDPETGKVISTGDCLLRTHCSWNMTRDPGLKVEDIKWYIITYRVNKFDLAASYPRFKNEILACGEKDNLPELPMNHIPDGSDSIYVHLLVHDRTASVPDGRYAMMAGETIIMDHQTGLPFDDFPIERLASSDVIDSCLGYAAANDILALEEVTDALNSIVTTNQITFGGQTIVGPEGANFDHTDLAKGVRYIELPENQVEKVRALELTKTAPEIFTYIEYLGRKKEQQVGSNSVVRGQPEGQLSGASGTALALVYSQAISFNSGTQNAYFRVMSSTMTKLIRILQKYADMDRIAHLVGKNKSKGLKSFKYNGNDLKAIASIVYEPVNPMSQTLGGKLTFAQDLLKAGQLKNPKQYINLATTGNLDALTEDDEDDGMLILDENEALREGRPVIVVITEMHADHIKSHNSQITQKAKETDPEFVKRVEDHVQQHIDLWMQASRENPGLLIATGQQVLPPPIAMMMPGGMPGMMPPPSPPGGPGGKPSQGPQNSQEMMEMMSGGSPEAQKAVQVQKAQLPNIAGTDQKPAIPGITDSLM